MMRRSKSADEVLGGAKTANYRPPILGLTSPVNVGTNWSLFNLWFVDEMRRDHAVRQALAFKMAPIHKAEFEFACDNATVKRFIETTILRIWQKSIGIVLECLPYGFYPAEVMYEERDGLVMFDSLLPIHPRDVRAWVYNGKLSYIKVIRGINDDVIRPEEQADRPDSIRLEAATPTRPAKGFWAVYQPQFNRWYGQSVMLPSWIPWRYKTMGDGAFENLFKAYYKYAYNGMVISYPSSLTVQTEVGGPVVSAQDYARQMAEMVKAGAGIAKPSDRDDKGNPLWEIDSYGGNMPGDFQSCIEYPEYLDRLITRGMTIPDEILTHRGEGSFARSHIAWMAFLILEEEILNHILETIDDQIVRPLVRMNFGAVRYEIKPLPLLQEDESMQGQIPGMEGPGESPEGYGEMIPYKGPRGGIGFKDPVTDKVVYTTERGRVAHPSHAAARKGTVSLGLTNAAKEAVREAKMKAFALLESTNGRVA